MISRFMHDRTGSPRASDARADRPAVTGGVSGPRAKFVALDGLRGLAAILVVLLHVCTMVGWWRPGSGFLAVDLFFMLSGFVVPYAYEAKLGHGLSFARFAEIRLIRLYPLYILGVGICVAGFIVAALAAGGPWPLKEPAKWLPWALFLLPYPTMAPGQSFLLNPPAWSLFLELVVNAAYALCLPWLGRRALIGVIAVSAIILAVADMRYGGGDFGTGGIQMLWGLARVTCPFAIGILMYRHWAGGSWRAGGVPPLLPPLLFLGLTVMPGTGAIGVALAPVLVVAGLTAIVWLAIRSRPEGMVARVYEATGLLSFPLYALHMPILTVCRMTLPMLGVGQDAATFVGVPIAFGGAALAIRAYDEPVRRVLTRLAALRRAQVERAPAL